MIKGAWLPAGAAVAAGVVHAIAGSHLAAVDPIAAVLGRSDAGGGVVVAAAGVAAARLFLLFVAPGWAAHVVMKCIARAIYLPPK